MSTTTTASNSKAIDNETIEQELLLFRSVDSMLELLNLSTDKFNEVGSIMAEFKSRWDSAPCDSEGATKEQDEVMDKILQDASDSLLDLMIKSTTTSQVIGLTINDQVFTNLQELENYIESNELDIDSAIDLQAMIDTNSTLVECEIINYENTQNTITCYIDSDDEAYEKAKIELTITSQYHRFHNTLADKFIADIEKQWESGEDWFPFVPELDKDMLEEINEQINNYNQYGDKSYIKQGMSVQDIIEILS
jgi:hypothetical protein